MDEKVFEESEEVRDEDVNKESESRIGISKKKEEKKIE
jgi:hypothetical protein